jgi:Rhodopirellula transposase DDE domain
MKFEVLAPVMDERMTRLWAAAEAVALGAGGNATVTRATGIRGKRLWMGRKDLDELLKSPPTEPARAQRVRRPGAGRKPLSEIDPTLAKDLESLIDPVTRGDPESPLRWTCKSTAKLTEALRGKGHQVGETSVRHLLAQLGYSLQANVKVREGSNHPDRNAQFEYINAQAEAFFAANEPVISVDTKKKELIGDYKNAGREWHPKGQPERVQVHDFVDPELGKAIPYGVYDVGRDEGWVSVGIDHDTAAFAVSSITQWWKNMGTKVYPDATRLLITADSGGSNSAKSRLWKLELQDFADVTGLDVAVCHFPPGTSKWNKIEHRLFSQISMNWRGRPLLSHQTVVNLIAATRTRSGLKVRARLDRGVYPLATDVSDAEMQKLDLRPHDFHADWNYTLVSRIRRSSRSVISA